MKKYRYHLIAIMVTLGYAYILTSCNKKEARQAPPPEIEVVKIIIQDVPIIREFVGQSHGMLDIPQKDQG
jgi:hypothetical protein